MNNTTQKAKIEIDFKEFMNKLLGFLTDRERDVIERRFAIGYDKKETLDHIGKHYSVTRERIRQIEAVAIQKLARISQDKSIKVIHDIAITILQKFGGVMSEDLLVSEMLKTIDGAQKTNTNSLKFTMRVSKNLIKHEKNQFFKPFWHVKELPFSSAKSAMKDITKILKKNKEIMPIEDIASSLKEKYPKEMIKSLMYVDWNFLEVEGKWGLTSWRHINPRSIRDCIAIILKEKNEPLHFSKIMKQISITFPERRKVTPQASHNELIRHPEFVLLGRGMYGLKEWGMAAGTVCDLIRMVLVENGGTMKRKDIIAAVLEKRDVRTGTISLSLQKYPFFERTGRAVYTYNKDLDNQKRRRGSKYA
jgi:hypothetical protein